MVEVKNSGVAEKEQVNEYRKDLMDKAMNKIKSLSEKEYAKRVTSFSAHGGLRCSVRTLIPGVVPAPF